MRDTCRHGHAGQMVREKYDGKLRCKECRRESNRRARHARSLEVGAAEDIPALVLRLLQHIVAER